VAWKSASSPVEPPVVIRRGGNDSMHRLLDTVANIDCSTCCNRGGIRTEIDSGLQFASSITPDTSVHLLLD